MALVAAGCANDPAPPAQVSQGIKVANICAAALIGIVGEDARGTAVIMLDKDGFDSIISAMSGGMITAVSSNRR